MLSNILSAAPITFFLLITNVLISGYALFMDQSLINKWSFRPVAILKNREYHRMITGGFLHGSTTHLLFNMVTLFFFGPTIEMYLGPIRYLIVYFGAEIAAHMLTMHFHKDDPSYSAVGASGAISGILFSFCLFEPWSKIYLMLIPIGIPAFLFAILYVGFSAYAMKGSGDQQGQGSKIAHVAHLGGALGGMILTILIYPDALAIFLSNF